LLGAANLNSLQIRDGDRLAFVDGLRAVAVLLVLLYHFGIPGFGNGFLGVDIFFVISGFVVTRMIMGRLSAGRFRWSDFYIARLLRIAPAMYFWTAISLGLASLLFLPATLVGAAGAAITSIAFVSNSHSLNNYNYFDSALTNSPMLHHWSLSVEMQFYLVTPWLLILGHRHLGAKALPAAIAVLALVSVLHFQAEWNQQPLRAFHLPTTRAWEYLVGSIIALSPPAIPRRSLQTPILWAGVLAVVAGLFLGRGFSIGPVALVVCGFGLALASLREQSDLIVRPILERPALVALGRISYSVYLAHWPILVFVQYWWIKPLPIWLRLFLLPVSIALGWLSWKYIEQKFRPVKSSPKATMLLVAATLAVGFAIAASAFALRLHPGLSLPASQSTLSANQTALGISPMRQVCHATLSGHPDLASRSCILGAPVSPDVAIWGDSHGVELSFALGEILRAENRSLLQKTTSSCPPWAGLTVTTNPQCSDQNNRVLNQLTASNTIKTVVLVMYRDAYAEGEGAIERSLRQSVSRLRASGKSVIILAPFPNPRFHVPDGLTRSRLFWPGRPLAPISRTELRAANPEWSRMLAALANEKQIDLVDPAQWMCGANTCPLFAAEQPLYFDDNHPTLAGVAALSRHLSDVTRGKR
jgi:peptidoglycan/LPS O-acetylase OafA/YrhL/lysophospholipase L1-like esterase